MFEQRYPEITALVTQLSHDDDTADFIFSDTAVNMVN